MGFIGRAVAPAPITANDVPDLPASKITSGTFGDSRISASSVSQHATSFDDNNIVNDLSTLGLRVHSQENLIASNSNSASFDAFQDSSGVTALTNASRSTDEYMGSITQTSDTSDTGGTLTDITSSNTYFSSAGSNDNYGDGNDIGIDGSSNYSFWSPSALLTGNFKLETNGASTGGASTNADADNRFEFGVTSQQGSSSNGTTGGVQQNASLWYSTGATGTNTAPFIYVATGGYGQTILLRKNTGSTRTTIATISDSWGSSTKLSFARKGSTLFFMMDDVLKHTFSSSEFNTSGNLYYMFGFGVTSPSNWTDCKYRSGMTTIKGAVNTTENASGSFEGATITAGASTSSMGAVITYQDNAGTNTLNTDIILKLSANNGSNYSTATLTALPDFATGIKMAKVNDLSVTAGTQLKYKIEFANQSLGVKEARIRGVSLQY